MNIWKVSMGKGEIDDILFNNLITNNFLLVHPKTAAKGQSNITQGENYTNANIGDIFYLCRSNDFIELIGMFVDTKTEIIPKGESHETWGKRKFRVLFKAKNKNAYRKFIDNKKAKWWYPNNRSTFIKIPDSQHQEFDEMILNPVFDITLKEIISKQKKELLLLNINQKTNLLKYQKQIIIQGPPGTGKTRVAKQMAIKIINEDIKIDTNEDIKKSLLSIDKNQVKLIQFHPSYSYEDFVRGIVATTTKDGKGVKYETQNKILATMAEEAKKEWDKVKNKKEAKPFILIIDEINRANLSSVLGELIYALEYRDEAVESMYELDKNREIILPSNLYIIGTMNTADRSTGYIDYAIRRRFTFVDVLPDKDVVNSNSKFKDVQELFKDTTGKRADTLSVEFNPDDVMLGHSYFIADNNEELENKLKYQVIPLLKEYIKDGVLNEKANYKIKEL